MSGKNIEVRVENGGQARLEDLQEKALEAVRRSGVDAKVKKGSASNSIGVHDQPELRIDGKLVAHPETLTVRGLEKMLQLAAQGTFDETDEPLSLPFSERFHTVEGTAQAGETQVGELIDDATGVVYLTANGALTPLLHASGKPQRVW